VSDGFHRRLAEHARLPFLDDEALAATVTDSVTPETARFFGIVPVADDGETLVVATADPARVDEAALGALTRREIRLAVATPDAIRRELARLDQPPPDETPANHPERDYADPAPTSTVPAMPDFRRTFRGYRRSDVDQFAANAAAAAGRMQQDLEGANARSSAMLVEIRDLHARVDQLRQREASVSRSLDEMREQREQFERESRRQATELVQEAQERAVMLKSEGLRQVGELQLQVEQLLGMRAGLTQALQRLSEDLAASMARVASSPATAIDRPIEHHVERWSQTDREQ
jgi:cell division septum initiation protein DivIVA